MNWIIAFAFAIAGVGCAARPPRPEQVRNEDRKKIETELSGEMSLKADRDSLSELRKNIPAETQKTNDELAMQLNLMKQGTEAPATFRERFTSLMQGKRTDFRKKVERLRNDFRTEETRRREDFTTKQRKAREAYFSSKRDREQSSRFSADLEKVRLRFFADERDRRSGFESELSARSKDFESYMRERNNEFNEQYRLYSKKFSEKPKEKKAVTGGDFQKLDELPTKTLSTED